MREIRFEPHSFSQLSTPIKFYRDGQQSELLNCLARLDECLHITKNKKASRPINRKNIRKFRIDYINLGQLPTILHVFGQNMLLITLRIDH